MLAAFYAGPHRLKLWRKRMDRRRTKTETQSSSEREKNTIYQVPGLSSFYHCSFFPIWQLYYFCFHFLDMDPQSQIDISKLSDADKKELNQFLESEAQKTNIQQSKELKSSFWTFCLLLLAGNFTWFSGNKKLQLTLPLISCPPPCRYLLEEMCYRENNFGPPGSYRGGLRAELRWKMDGYKLGRLKTSGNSSRTVNYPANCL